MKTMHVLNPCWHYLPRECHDTLRSMPNEKDGHETRISVTDSEWLVLNIKYPYLQELPNSVGNIWIEHGE